MNPDRPLKRSTLPLGSRVRFNANVAPRAAETYGRRVATVVRRNVVDGEVGITFGYAAPRPDKPNSWNWSNGRTGDAIVWAEPRELDLVRSRCIANPTDEVAS